MEDDCGRNNGSTGEQIEGPLERLKQLFVLGDLSETDYRRKRDRGARLPDLTLPELPDLQRATELLQDFGTTWDTGTPKKKKQAAHTLLEAVHLDGRETVR